MFSVLRAVRSQRVRPIKAYQGEDTSSDSFRPSSLHIGKRYAKENPFRTGTTVSLWDDVTGKKTQLQRNHPGERNEITRGEKNISIETNSDWLPRHNVLLLVESLGNHE